MLNAGAECGGVHEPSSDGPLSCTDVVRASCKFPDDELVEVDVHAVLLDFEHCRDTSAVEEEEEEEVAILVAGRGTLRRD